MLRTTSSRIVSCLMVLSLTVAFASVEQPALGADTVKKVLPKRVRARGRLPDHYGEVVTEEQREKIYEIQEEYRPKIEPLETQLKALKDERDAKIAAVLTPEQKKKVEEADANAKEKAKAMSAKPAENAPPPPTGQNPAK
jgi:Spy/CpxP family protein refolding chaperone